MSVYFIQAAHGGPIKIGYSQSVDGVELRRVRMQTGYPYPLVVRHIIDGGRDVEAEWHREYAHLRLHGEWFAAEVELARKVHALATPIGFTEELLDIARRTLTEEMIRATQRQAWAKYEAEVDAQVEKEVGSVRHENERYLRANRRIGRGLKELALELARRDIDDPVTIRRRTERLMQAYAQSHVPVPRWLASGELWPAISDDPLATLNEIIEAEKAAAGLR